MERRSTYDDVPYRSYPYPQTCPDRLATIATLFGMNPPPVAQARVLELGCSFGGNIVPVAELWPETTCVGLDMSSRQIADGQAGVRELGLRNINLMQADILSVGKDLGTFDYIIAHGVFAWVPPAVQEKILAICSENLSPNGVAYISYNTNPGWRMRGIIRDIMMYRSRSFEKPADRVAQARALVDFLARSVSQEDNAYGLLLRKELEMLRDKDDYYLFHEHLEEHNEPLYFHQFIGRAQAQGLQYLGEADFGSMSLKNMPQHVETVIKSVAGDLIELEQYMDFVRNRMFRQTLLCHGNVELDRSLSPERVGRLYVASSAKPEGPVEDLRSREKVVFKNARATTTTSEPMVKAAFMHLARAWPASVAFNELLATARSAVSGSAAVVGTSGVGPDGRALADTLLRCYASGQVELSVEQARFVAEAGDRPAVSALVRWQAERGSAITNRRHEPVELDDLDRHLVKLLDGTRDRQALIDAMARLAAEGELIVHDAGQAQRDPQRLAEMLVQPIQNALARLAGRAVLVA